MNLSEIKEELIEKLKATTEIEIFAGKLEKVFKPWFLERTNSSDKTVEDCLEEIRKNVKSNFSEFLASSEVGQCIDKYNDSLKYFSDLNVKLTLLANVTKLTQKIHFADYRIESKINDNPEFKLLLSKLKSSFKPELTKMFYFRDIANFCFIKEKQISAEIKSLENSYNIKKKEIQDLFERMRETNEDVIFLTDEENSLRFFYKLLLDKEIKDNYVDFFSIRFHLKENRSQSERQLFNYLKLDENILPKSWRKFLNEILTGKIPNFSGHRNYRRFEKAVSKLSNVDYSYLLALKSALNYQEGIITEDNEIFLALSGGMMAKIGFKEKPSFVETFQQKETEIYFQKNDNRNFQKLYSYISIEHPNQWFLLTKEFVIEIGFESAPILFGNASIAEVATAKQIEDIEEEERSAQERDDEENEKSRRRFY